ncbi:unnamed protein product [Rotaria magnacalcarata]|uniref:Uncharacterized protein n=1 Tax=Rotaria magnacalcarata TaxID=392030 RepID=A0A816UY08_9BILA|nr:unnamed protein product [Rotaria magnacalcarata]CAF3744603.1 unnamed protein product [Rotaria magnacalcarata]CAF3982784.1 unnamed protein product [Rotaria magnacalcarata]
MENESVQLSSTEQQSESQQEQIKPRRHSSLSISLSSKSNNKEMSILSAHSKSHVIYFGCEQHSGNELWDTSYFFSLLFELLDDYKDISNEESRLAAFIICRLNDINLNSQIPIKLVIQILKYFNNIRLKILVLLELLNMCETIDCTQALMLLWEFSTYGYVILFYIIDRIKFSIVDKDVEWKSLLTIFEPLENKKHAAYILLDKTNFYKPNKATIVFGSKKFERYF